MDLVSAIGIVLFALAAGLLGALLGLGGGIIIIPALTLVFGYPMQEAIGASLVAVIASAVGSASHYVEQGLSNIRLGLILGIATSLGSLIGALVAVYTNQYILAAAFGMLLLYTAIYMIRKRNAVDDVCPVDQGGRMDLSCSYIDCDNGKPVEYGVRNLEKGMVASLGGGSVAGLLGVGGGIINVPIMKAWMGVPFRAACATSNFMIGLTALAGAIVYYEFGLINAVLAAIVALGTFTGAMAGSRLSSKVQGGMLKLIFAIVLIAVAVLMFLKAAGVMT
jgi:uncharacterized membrane protein YfcA